MHVLQILPGLTVGGVERGVVDLAHGLTRRGHRVSIISSGGPMVEQLPDGVTHYVLPVHDKHPAVMLRCLPQVTRIIRSTQVDLVHARSRVPGWIGWLAARQTQRPFITTAHGFYKPHPASRVMAWGRTVIVPSEALGRYLVERFGVPRERLRVIPRGVDLEEFVWSAPRQAPEGRWRIGLFGRLSPIKGQAVAIRAIARLVRDGLPVRLCLAGDVPGSPMHRTLEALIAELKVEEAVEWLGVRQDMPSLIASMDLVISPSTYPESFGRTVVEAMAVGRPVVASQAGALSELIEHGRNGLLVAPGDPHALSEAIARLLTDAPLRQRCVEEGRRRVEASWSAEAMVDRTLAVYEECLTQPRVLIWKLSALGDVILSTPSLRALRRQFPKGRLTLAVGRASYEAVAHCPYLDDIIVYDSRGKDRGPIWHLRFVQRLRREAFDLSVDLQNSRKTHAMAWLAGVPVRIGYRRKFRWLLNRGVRVPRVVLAPVAQQQHLLRQSAFAIDGDQLELWPSPEDEASAAKLLGPVEPGRTIIGVHPGGSGRWQTKRWDIERWAALCDALSRQNVHVVVTGGPDEQGLAGILRSHISSAPTMLIGKTSLMELACVIKQCHVFLAQDSSSLHVASAMGTPTVALFGPTDARRHLPPNFRGTVIHKDVFCSPCYSPQCRTITHACMKRIGVEEVLQAVLALLADSERVKLAAAG